MPWSKTDRGNPGFVIGAGVAVGLAVAKHGIEGSQHFVSGGDEGAFVAASGGENSVIAVELAVTGASSAVGAFGEHGAQGLAARAGSARPALAGTLVIAGAQAGPGSQPVGRAEGLEVRTDLGEDGAGRDLIDARDGLQQQAWLPEGFKLFTDGLVERCNPGHERVVFQQGLTTTAGCDKQDPGDMIQHLETSGIHFDSAAYRSNNVEPRQGSFSDVERNPLEFLNPCPAFIAVLTQRSMPPIALRTPPATPSRCLKKFCNAGFWSEKPRIRVDKACHSMLGKKHNPARGRQMRGQLGINPEPRRDTEMRRFLTNGNGFGVLMAVGLALFLAACSSSSKKGTVAPPDTTAEPTELEESSDCGRWRGGRRTNRGRRSQGGGRCRR